MNPSRFVVVGMLLALPTCGGDATGLGATPGFATVVFSYTAPTATDPAVASAFSQCVQGVSANGTLLSRVVDTPGSGIEPGLAFEVAADGSVTP